MIRHYAANELADALRAYGDTPVAVAVGMSPAAVALQIEVPIKGDRHLVITGYFPDPTDDN